MSEARATIDALSKDFDRTLIRTKPGSKPDAKYFKPATKYVSHGSVTKRLNDAAPGWSSRVVETHSFMNANGVLVCAGVTLELTIPGVGSRQEVGTANQPRNFGDDLKNAMSDALKRCAMRFGVAIDLWESMDEADEDAAPAPRPAPRQTPQDEPNAASVTPVQERTIAEAWDMASEAQPYPAVVNHLRQLQADASPDQWTAIKRALAAIKAKHYAQPEEVAR